MSIDSANTVGNPPASEPIRRVGVLGVEVDLIDPPTLLNWIVSRVGTPKPIYVANHNIHSVALFHDHPLMRTFYRFSDLIVIDSMPLVGFGRLVAGKPVGRSHRVSWLDHLFTIFEVFEERGWRVAHLGGEPGLGEKAEVTIRRRCPRLNITTHHGHFAVDGPEEDAVFEWLESAQPHLVLVGMGMPRQEEWLAKRRDRLPPAIYMTSGGTFDCFAEKIPTAPRWLGPLGLEWTYRLAIEPRRLSHRYLVEPLGLLPWALRDLKDRFTGGEGGR